MEATWISIPFFAVADIDNVAVCCCISVIYFLKIWEDRSIVIVVETLEI